MKDDFSVIVKKIPNNNDIVIRPVGDLHYGSPEFDCERWKAFKADCLKNNHYIVLVGDMMNNGLKTSVTNVYEETCRPRDQKRWLVEELKPFAEKGLILAAVGGNHERRSLKDADDDPLYDVLAKLDLEDIYRQNIAFLIVRFGTKRDTNYTLRPSYSVVITHGAGGGMYIGSGINRTERFGQMIDGMDLMISGHTHKPSVVPSSKLVFDTSNDVITRKQFTLVTCSSWLEYGGYPVQKLLSPTAQADQHIILSGHGKSIRVLQ